MEQRRAERARGVPQLQRAFEPEQQPGLSLCRAHDGAGWPPPEQTGVLSVALGGGKWFSATGVLVAQRGCAGERSPVACFSLLGAGREAPGRTVSMELFSAMRYTRIPLILFLTLGFEVTTMGKGNNARTKEKNKPKKAAAPKPISVKAVPPAKKP